MSEWKEVKIGDFCSITRGASPRPIQEFISPTGTPWVKISDAKNNCKYITTTKECIRKEGEQKSRVVYPGDFILSNSATPGLPRFMKIRACIHDGWLLLRDIVDVDKFFLYYLLLTEREALLMKGNGSIFTNLKTDILKNHIVKLPPLPEQKAIAEVLSSLDDKIDLLNRQNKTLEEMAETFYESCIFEKDFNSNISDIISIQNGYAFKSKDFQNTGNHRILKIKNISGGFVDIQSTDFVSDKIITKVADRFMIKSGDVLFAMTGAKIGKMGIIPHTNNSLWINQRVGLFKERFRGARFLAYLHLKSDFGIDYIENTSTGSAQPNISSLGIEKCEFPCIPTHELKKYCEQLDLLFGKVIFNLGQISTIQNIRDTMLPKLMNGELKVNLR